MPCFHLWRRAPPIITLEDNCTRPTFPLYCNHEENGNGPVFQISGRRPVAFSDAFAVLPPRRRHLAADFVVADPAAREDAAVGDRGPEDSMDWALVWKRFLWRCWKRFLTSCRRALGQERCAGMVFSDVIWGGFGARVGRAFVWKGCHNR